MKRLLICVVALIAVVALVIPSYAAEMKLNGLNHIRFITRDNFDGDSDTDDNANYVTQRFRMYFTSIASENLKLVYRNEIDFEWGDFAQEVNRNEGGGVAGDQTNLETKQVYVEFMVPDTPVKATLGLQGITLHEGWAISNDISATRFDMNFDPVSILAYWAFAKGAEGRSATVYPDGQTGRGNSNFSDSSDDVWQIVVSGGYKAENMDARLTLGYERGQNAGAGGVYDTADTDDNDFYLLMGEFGMSFDMVSFKIIAGLNAGEADGSGSASDGNRDYSGYMFQGKVNLALDMADLRALLVYASGDKEDDFDDDFRGLSGMAVAWGPEIITNGYFYDRDALLNQIGGCAFTAGDESPNNLMAVGVGATFKPADNTSIYLDLYYLSMIEKRTVDGSKEDELGIEIDARLAQKIYDNLTFNFVAAYLFADNGYGTYPTPADQSSGDDAYQVGIGIDYSF